MPAGAGVEGLHAAAAAAAALVRRASHTQPIRGVRATGGVVVDVASGRVVWAHDAHRRLPVASLTKLMTALSRCRSRRRSTASSSSRRRWSSVPGYTIGLRAGRRVTVRRMLAAALIASANDAANVLAVHRAGSLAAFVALMNAEAAPPRPVRHALLEPVRDLRPRQPLVGLGRRRPVPACARRGRCCGCWWGARPTRPARSVYVNRNRLLWSYPGAIGLKTGSTTAAGNCLAVAATHHGRTLVAVLLHVRGDEFAAATRLLDWGFRHDR